MKCQVAAGQPGPPPASEAGAPGALAIGSVSAAGIQRARERLRGHVRETPCFASPRLSQACEVELFVKHEYQQVTGSFKERGACNRLLALGADERARARVSRSAARGPRARADAAFCSDGEGGAMPRIRRAGRAVR